MELFLRIFQQLLPNARAWRITVDKQLRQFFQGLTGLGSDTREFTDLVYKDIDPQETRELTKWEGQFGLADTGLAEQERRDRLAATWQALGGQSPRYIQDTLQAAGFNVYVHEWWELPIVGSRVARSPLAVLNDGVQPLQYIVSCGANKANCGNPEAVCGASIQPTGAVLVNKILVPEVGAVAGAQLMSCGNPKAICGLQSGTYIPKQYVTPIESGKWPYFLYIGGQTYPDHATVSASRRNEFETLCLKICPNQQWLGLLIDYT